VPEGAERFRLIPTGTAAAQFWHRRLALFVGWFAFGWATVDVLKILGFTPEARAVVAYALGLGLLAIALNVAWTRPLPAASEVPEALPAAIAISEKASRHALRPHDGSGTSGQTGLMAVYLDRGIRALLIAGAVLLLADAWHIDLVEMTSRDTLLTRLMRGALSAVVVLLVVDLRP
jgi:hypothetical protein